MGCRWEAEGLPAVVDMKTLPAIPPRIKPAGVIIARIRAPGRPCRGCTIRRSRERKCLGAPKCVAASASEWEWSIQLPRSNGGQPLFSQIGDCFALFPGGGAELADGLGCEPEQHRLTAGWLAA